MDCALVAQLASVTATLMAVLVALFKEQLQSLFFTPKLTVSVGTHAPFSVKTQSVVFEEINGKRQALWAGTIYWSRIWVENIGNRRAESVEVFVSNVERLNRDGTHAELDGFIPSNLRWANAEPGTPVVVCGINPRMGRFCDLGSVADPQCTTLQDIKGAPKGTATFDLVLQSPLPRDAHRLAPGDYRITLRISAANAKPFVHLVQVSISGKWTQEAPDMFNDYLGVSVCK
jgi:hypothetical protein